MLNILGKRPREHLHPSGPTVALPQQNHPSGLQGIPSVGGQMPVTSRSLQVNHAINPTASIPLMIRPWQEHFEKLYSPGSFIFTLTTAKHSGNLTTVADIPTLNYLFANRGGSGPEQFKNLRADEFQFFGIFRNDAGKQVDYLGNSRYTNPKQRLLQCDVYGRARASNIWGRKVRTGDRLGLAVVLDDSFEVKKPNASGYAQRMGRKNFKIVPTVNDTIDGVDMNKDDDMNIASTEDDGSLLELDASVLDNKRPLVRWHVGVVSSAAYEPPSDAAIAFAMNSSEGMTCLPQIEILMI